MRKFHSDEDIIVARCTPQGSGALALIRICGTGALQLVSSLARLSSKQELASVSSHTIHHGYCINPDNAAQIIDEVLFFVMLGTRTFVGQDTVEISCHNNPFIIECIITTIIAAGARSAQPGEFTKRAFLNGKIDLVQAEAINDLIHASSEQALKQSMQQLQGSLSSRLHILEQHIMHALTLVEASFEFLEEEQGDLALREPIIAELHALVTYLYDLTKDYTYQGRVREGVRVVLLGSVNAGKSTLFNALVGKNRAIVSDQAGTTRDSIEQSMHSDGMFYVFVDTAGLRSTDDVIEAEGIKRSFNEAEAADIILLAVDGSNTISDQERNVYHDLCERYASKIIVVVTKADVVTQTAKSKHTLLSAPELFVSAATGNGVDALRKEINNKIKSLYAHHTSPFLLNQRQYDILQSMLQNSNVLQQQTMVLHDPELLAITLRSMLEQLAEVMGKSVTEKLFDHVFKQFCIGK